MSDSFNMERMFDTTGDSSLDHLGDTSRNTFGSSTLFGTDMNLYDSMTVSPAALSMNFSSFDSEPPSGTYPQTDFTPPTDLDTSPYGYTTSPAFATVGAEANYPPLFGTSPITTRPMARNLSSTSNSSSGNAARGHTKRPSLTNGAVPSNGVGKSRQRRTTKDLPPIEYDNTDPVARKRARNTMAARVSRSNKAQKMEQLEKTVELLRAELTLCKTELSLRGYDGPLLNSSPEPEEDEMS